MLLSASFLMLMPISQNASADIARAEQERLNTCIELVETQPEEAYEDSLAWLANGNRPKARYCNAIALLAMDNLEEGAARLEALAGAPDPITLDDRARYLAQAGNAWLTANYPEAAIVALSEAIRIEPNGLDTYKDRAAAYLATEKWVEGVDDLNTVLREIPTDAEALRMRAKAHLETENLSAAQADITDSLVHDPENIDTLVLRGEVREAIRLSRENG